MKLRILLMACLLLPVVVFSQQTGEKSSTLNKQTKVIAVKKQIQTQPTLVAKTETVNIESYRKANGVPDDFPRYKDTGNPILDKTNYHDAKQKWITDHPVEFEKIKHLNL